MVNNIYVNSKVIGAKALTAALLLSLSACSSGFRAQSSEQVSSESVDDTGAYVIQTNDIEFARKLASTVAGPANKPVPTKLLVAVNDNQPLNIRFLNIEPKLQEHILATRFKHVDPKREIDSNLLKKALLFYFVNRKNFGNQNVMTVIDYSIPSNQKRLYVIDLKDGRVWSTYVAHGKGSDRNHDGLPESFTNKQDSNATSLGPFMTMNTYKGDHGLSLRLKGLAKSNSNALVRNVVIHGAWYVKDESVKQGRSQGCPAVAKKYTAKLITAIKGGSLVYSGASKPSLHREL